MRSVWKSSSLLYIAILLAGVAFISFLVSDSQKPTEIGLDEVIAISQSGKIQELVLDKEALLITTTEGKKLKTFVGNLNYLDLKALGLKLDAVVYGHKPSGMDWGNLLIGFLPLLLFGALLFFLFSRARGANNQAFSFGRSRARLQLASKPTTTFEDVAGVDEAKQELFEVVEFLKSREKFQSLGARIPKGVLLVGPPGTGKTLLAKAVAGEADVPFFSISGSEFVEMFVGVGAARVRDLFEQAKRHAPCIIFVDEIDAVGRHRGAGMGGSHDEREQTLNQILTEMDGFDTGTSVIVLAATNRPDILDPALLRPGRFDRRVILDRPDILGRIAILKVHAKDKPLAESVNLEVLARETAGFSGADLANLVNEAAILAARRDKKAVEMKEFEESIDRVLAGPERKSRRISSKEKEITAYHEAGHAMVAKKLPNADPPHKISIVARGIALGYTKTLSEDRYMWARSKCSDDLAVWLGGRAAEEQMFGDVTTGAQDDIKRATELARKMVTDFGMSKKLGPRTFGDKQELVFLGKEISEQKDYGDKVADAIDKEISSIINNAYKVAKKILAENREKLIHLAQKLITEETIENEELEALFSETTAPPTSALAPALQTPSTPLPVPVEATINTEPAPKRKNRTISGMFTNYLLNMTNHTTTIIGLNFVN
ncbi:ATP-dependent zinc metalloprotease FtsH [Chloroflexota bacterium]